jgi:hypothetical protein
VISSRPDLLIEGAFGHASIQEFMLAEMDTTRD